MLRFKKKALGPSVPELIRQLTEALDSAERVAEKNKDSSKMEKKVERAEAEEVRCIGQVKTVLYGDEAHEADPATVMDLLENLIRSGLIVRLLRDLQRLAFEARKDVAIIMAALLRKQVQGQNPLVEYLLENGYLLTGLIDSYGVVELTGACGSILRECIRSEPLTNQLLTVPTFQKFAALVENPNFDVSSDAFLTFKELLCRHRVLTAAFLDAHFSIVFRLPEPISLSPLRDGNHQAQSTSNTTHSLMTLATSESYVTKRQCIKLLSELLLDRANFAVMTRFIDSVDNLKAIMMLLKDKSKTIQWEAFHVFKIFAANPRKKEEVASILKRNQAKLIEYLEGFTERDGDQQFADEKRLIIQHIQDL